MIYELVIYRADGRIDAVFRSIDSRKGCIEQFGEKYKDIGNLEDCVEYGYSYEWAKRWKL